MADKPKLTIHFSDFWNTFDPRTFWIYKLLAEMYDIVQSSINPELLVYSDYGIMHLKYACHKIYYSHENRRANPNLCDYSFTFHGLGGNHRFFSNLAEDQYYYEVLSEYYSETVKEWRATPKTRFCNFVVSNGDPQERIRFCRQLMKYKHVDCPGKVLNNHPPFDVHGYQYSLKYSFISHYKFTIAFENESVVRYTTEKILHPFIVGSIPIYWGNPRVAELFNPKSFINCHDYRSFDEVISRVAAIDQDERLYAAYRAESPILPKSPLMALSGVELAQALRGIAEARNSGNQVSTRWWFPARRLEHFLRYKLANRWEYLCQQFDPPRNARAR